MVTHGHVGRVSKVLVAHGHVEGVITNGGVWTCRGATIIVTHEQLEGIESNAGAWTCRRN